MNSLGERFVLGIDKFERIHVTIMLILLLYAINRCSSWYYALFASATINYYMVLFYFSYIFYQLLHKICERREGLHEVCRVNKDNREFTHYLLKVTCSTDYVAFLCITWIQSFHLCDSRHCKFFTKFTSKIISIRLLKTDLTICKSSSQPIHISNFFAEWKFIVNCSFKIHRSS